MIDPEMNLELRNLANRSGNSDAGSLKYRLGMVDELSRFQLELVGLIKNPEFNSGENKGKRYIVVPGAQMCGDAGAIAITNYIRNAVDKVASDTKLDDKTIKRMSFYFDVEFCKWMMRNIRTLQIIPTHCRAISGMAVRLFELTINRSIGGWMGEGLNRGLSHSEVHHIEETSKKQNKFEGFLQGGNR